MAKTRIQSQKEIEEKRKVINKLAIIVAIVGAIYVICLSFGGEYKDFAENAIMWVYIGIGAAGVLTYSNITKKYQDNKTNKK